PAGISGGAFGRKKLLRAASAAAHALLHPLLHLLLIGVKLDLLLVGQNGADFVVGFGADGHHLRPHLGAVARLILKQRLHLLLPIFQDRLDLALLIRRQVILSGHLCQLGVRIHAAAATLGKDGGTAKG
ncbi:MAG TPA: hypothetical protein VFJ52_07060, partial [Terriglobia bacterium]|nr:hypothetical protein [Terriglobia bacterium]